MFATAIIRSAFVAPFVIVARLARIAAPHAITATRVAPYVAYSTAVRVGILANNPVVRLVIDMLT